MFLMNTARLTVIDAPGPGYAIQVLATFFRLVTGTVPYDAAYDLWLYWDGVSLQFISQVATAAGLNQPFDWAATRYAAASNLNITWVEDTPISLGPSTAPFITVGNGSAEIIIQYVIVPVG